VITPVETSRRTRKKKRTPRVIRRLPEAKTTRLWTRPRLRLRRVMRLLARIARELRLSLRPRICPTTQAQKTRLRSTITPLRRTSPALRARKSYVVELRSGMNRLPLPFRRNASIRRRMLTLVWTRRWKSVSIPAIIRSPATARSALRLLRSNPKGLSFLCRFGLRVRDANWP
jgi:hypothetical protein